MFIMAALPSFEQGIKKRRRMRAYRPEAAPQVKIQTVYSEAISCGD